MQTLTVTPSLTASARDDRPAWWLLGFGVIAAAWFAYYPLPFPTFYKEWIFAVAAAMAALVLRPQAVEPRALRHPLVHGAAAIGVALMLQAVMAEGLWPRSVLMGAYVAFFVFTISLGQRMHRLRGAQSLLWLAGFLLAAALGNCFFAALQLNWIEFSIPLVAPRPGAYQITGNLGQANHLADLLWLGVFSAAYLFARGRLGVVVFGLVVATLLFFSHVTGSRMIWVFAALGALIGVVLRLRSTEPQIRRMASAMLAVGGLLVLVTALMSATRVHDLFGLSSGVDRIATGVSAGSDQKRIWFWQMAIDATRHAPLLGLGAGRYAGHAHEMTMARSDGLTAGVESNAHNLWLHLAAELGLPAALILMGCTAWWLVAASRRAFRDVDAFAALVLCGVILVHSNIEYPLWYLYFLGLLGLLAGHIPLRDSAPTITANGPALGLRLLAPTAVLAVATVAYLHFGRLESAMQRVVMQVGIGAAPQSDGGLVETLKELPSWSPFRDHAELILLMTAMPTADNAADLAVRCDRAIAWAPQPYLLSRCATAHQVAGDKLRASYFADSMCKIFPRSGALMESMQFVGATSPAALDILSACIQRRH